MEVIFFHRSIRGSRCASTDDFSEAFKEPNHNLDPNPNSNFQPFVEGFVEDFVEVISVEASNTSDKNETGARGNGNGEDQRYSHTTVAWNPERPKRYEDINLCTINTVPVRDTLTSSSSVVFPCLPTGHTIQLRQSPVLSESTN